MDLETFQRAAERTMTNTTTQQERMLNAALGLCGEAAEVAKAWEYNESDLLEECGDLLWYIAQMCKAHDETIAHIPPDDQGWNEDRALEMLWHHSGYIADATKKLVFHGKPVNVLVFFDSLAQVVNAVDTLLGFTGNHVSDACEHNVSKLLRRHPNGFTPESANARLDEQEKK